MAWYPQVRECLEGGSSGATGRGFWGCGGGRGPWTASRRSASHAAWGMAASGAAFFWLAGVRVRIFPKVCTMCTPSGLPIPRPTSSAAELPQGGGRPRGEVGGGLGEGGLRALGPGAAMSGAGGRRCVWAAQGTGSSVLFLGGGGRGHRMAMAGVAAPGKAGGR